MFYQVLSIEKHMSQDQHGSPRFPIYTASSCCSHWTCGFDDVYDVVRFMSEVLSNFLKCFESVRSINNLCFWLLPQSWVVKLFYWAFEFDSDDVLRLDGRGWTSFACLDELTSLASTATCDTWKLNLSIVNNSHLFLEEPNN